MAARLLTRFPCGKFIRWTYSGIKGKTTFARDETALVIARRGWHTTGMRRLVHLVVLGAFVFSCGGHWYVLQAVAWANMIREYSQVVPVSQAVSMTLSGQYPCAMCHLLAEKENQHSQMVALEKVEKFLPPREGAMLKIVSASMEYAEFSRPLFGRTEAPPTPPPRLALS
jgi:hypothetical protein